MGVEDVKIAVPAAPGSLVQGGGSRGNVANRTVRAWRHFARVLLQASERSSSQGRITRGRCVRPRAVRFVMVAAAAAALGGCAAKAPPTLTDRFVRRGEATTDFGGRPPR